MCNYFCLLSLLLLLLLGGCMYECKCVAFVAAIAMQSRSAKQQRHKQHHQQQQQAGLPRITQKSIESAESNCN